MQHRLSNSSKQQVQEFVNRANQLFTTRLLKNGIPKISVNIKYERDKGLSQRGQFPDEEDFRSMLLSLRLFYMQKSKVNFYRIYNIVYQQTTDKKKQNGLASIRAAYAKALQRYPMPRGKITIKLRSHQYSPEEIIELWLNVNYFHVDLDNAKKEFDALIKLAGVPFLRFLMQDTAYRLASCVQALNLFIQTELNYSLKNP